MKDLKNKFLGLNPFNKLKEKTRLSFRNFNTPSRWFIAAAICFVSWLIVDSHFSPTNVQLDFIYQAKKDNKTITPYFSEQTAYSKNFLFDIDGKTYKVAIFNEKLDEDIKSLKEKASITLPQFEMSYSQKQRLKYYDDVLRLLSLLFFCLGVRQALSNHKNTRSDIVKEIIKTKFNEIAGIDSIKSELQEVVEHFKDSTHLKSFGGKVLQGVIMSGPPGTGKTMMAKAVAGETNSHFIAMSGSQFVEMYVGLGASRIRDLFKKARENTPCVIFIDEIDAFAKKRGSRDSHSEYDQTINELLAQMDGMKDNTGILVIAATNRLESIDDALLRPGRFDRKIRVDLPSVKGRKEILDLYIGKNEYMSKLINSQQLAKMTTYFSGADLFNLVNEAIHVAYKKVKSGARTEKTIEMSDFIDAKDQIQLGTVRDIKLSEKDKKETAYHEMGHALISYINKTGEVSQVTILPRGNALGVTHMTPDEKYSYSKEDLEHQIMMLLGGKCAEMLVFNKTSTGASNDLERATHIARQIACDFGMGDQGPVNLNYGSQGYQLLSDQMKYELDKEVMAILTGLETRTMKVLNDNKSLLAKLSEALIDKETILFDEFKALIDAHTQSGA
jgi:cell division protease FtsH